MLDFFLWCINTIICFIKGRGESLFDACHCNTKPFFCSLCLIRCLESTIYIQSLHFLTNHFLFSKNVTLYPKYPQIFSEAFVPQILLSQLFFQCDLYIKEHLVHCLVPSWVSVSLNMHKPCFVKIIACL